MILTMTKYHKNLLRDSPLSLLFIVKLFSSLETKMVLKIPAILKTCSEIVLCLNTPLQKIFLFQAVYIILKILNNFFWMTTHRNWDQLESYS